MKHVLAISFFLASIAPMGCGDSGDDGSTTITGDKTGCTINGGCVETEIPSGGDKAAAEKVCTDYAGTVSASCSGTKVGCCDTAADIRQCYYGGVTEDEAEAGCEGNQNGTWTPA